jgi:hypothetical protein
MRWNQDTSTKCGTIKWIRLDKILAKKTVSCICLGRSIYNGWCVASASYLSSETLSLIWDLNQSLSRKKLRDLYPALRPGTLTLIIEQRQVVIKKALADHGQAIQARMKVLRDCVATGQEFGLSGAAVRWITDAEEKGSKAKVRTEKQERASDYLAYLKCLRAEVEDVGRKSGQRLDPVFNSDELTISRTGDIFPCFRIMTFIWWAQEQTSMDSELSDLWLWLIQTIEATRRHRRKQRREHATKAHKQAETDSALIQTVAP